MDTERTIDLLDDNRTEIARLRELVSLQQRAIAYARISQDRQFLLLLPEIDARWEELRAEQPTP